MAKMGIKVHKHNTISNCSATDWKQLSIPVHPIIILMKNAIKIVGTTWYERAASSSTTDADRFFSLSLGGVSLHVHNGPFNGGSA